MDPTANSSAIETRLCGIYLRDVLVFLPRKQISAECRSVSLHLASAVRNCPDAVLPRRRFGTLHNFWADGITNLPGRRPFWRRVTFPKKCCRGEFEEIVIGLVGELIDPQRPPGWATRVCLQSHEHEHQYVYTDWENQLGTKEKALALLHFLHHLGELAFSTISSDWSDGALRSIYQLNPVILRALALHHQQTLGRPYLLHTREYRTLNENADALSNFLIPANGRWKVGADAGAPVKVIHAHRVVVHLADFGSVAQIMELARAVGAWCSKLVWACRDVQILEEAMQLANSYQPRPGDHPVQRVRINIGWWIGMEELTHLIPFDPSRITEKRKERDWGGKFVHIDPASGRRYSVGLKWDGIYCRVYFISSLRFSLP